MPSDYQKKKLAKKKEVSKQKGGKKAASNNVQENGESNGVSENGINGHSNGVTSTNGSKENSSEPTTYEGKVVSVFFLEIPIAKKKYICLYWDGPLNHNLRSVPDKVNAC